MTPRTLLGALALTIALPAAARDEPTVEYAADSTTETAQGALRGRVYHAPGKERRETRRGGEQMVTITRLDRKLVWMLMPEQKAYLQMPLGGSPDAGDVSAWETERTVIGPETIDGVKAIKSKVIMKNPRGDKMGGFWWTTLEGVTVKMDVISVDEGSKARLRMELKNLKVGTQDPALFEIPPGYQPVGVPGMGELAGMAGRAPAQGSTKKGEAGKKEQPPMPSMKDLGTLFK